MKLLNFENWSIGELSKIGPFQTFQILYPSLKNSTTSIAIPCNQEFTIIISINKSQKQLFFLSCDCKLVLGVKFQDFQNKKHQKISIQLYWVYTKLKQIPKS